MSISHYIKEIGRGTKGARSLTREQACDLMGQLLDGKVSDLELGGFCIAMRFKGESAEELAGFLDATQQRLPAWPQAAQPVVLIPSYNGARKLANLTPLLAALLAQQGLPVLVHGCDTENKRIGTEAVWQQLGWQVIDSPTALHAGDKVWMRTRHLLAPLERLLQIRRQMGLRNPAHSLVKLLDPINGAAFRTLRRLSRLCRGRHDAWRRYSRLALGDHLRPRAGRDPDDVPGCAGGVRCADIRADPQSAALRRSA